MAKGKRKLQADAELYNSTSTREVTVIAEFLLHLELRIEAARRIKLQKVRLDMLDMQTAESVDRALRLWLAAND